SGASSGRAEVRRAGDVAHPGGDTHATVHRPRRRGALPVRRDDQPGGAGGAVHPPRQPRRAGRRRGGGGRPRPPPRAPVWGTPPTARTRGSRSSAGWKRTCSEDGSMSHVVTIKPKVRAPAAVAAACKRLGLAVPVQGTARLYSGEATGLLVQLPGWRYPAVIDTATGEVRYANSGGCWGHPT